MGWRTTTPARTPTELSPAGSKGDPAGALHRDGQRDLGAQNLRQILHVLIDGDRLLGGQLAHGLIEFGPDLRARVLQLQKVLVEIHHDLHQAAMQLRHDGLAVLQLQTNEVEGRRGEKVANSSA